MDIESRNLDQLKKGEAARVRDFTDPELALKLMEMGILAGSEIRLAFSAPLGDPLCIELNGALLAMRRKEAKTVLID